MSKPSFKNPVTRPRAIIWTGVGILAFGLFFLVAVAATSSYWFCAEICHAVQDDSIYAYQNSSHNKVSCLACHMPAGADPVTFMLHKAVALKEIPLTLFSKYEIPLNGTSHLALDGAHMPSTQCTQCHDLSTRTVTPSAGIIINHDAHSNRNISCTACHNRIAHDEGEGYTPRNVDPNTGILNVGHADFMGMDACFRCHRLADDGVEPATPYKSAGGECKLCHTADFDLVPASHKEANFVKDKHGKMALDETAKVADQLAKEKEGDHKAKDPAKMNDEELALVGLPAMQSVNTCYTCHSKQFCIDCHGGVEMPHPAEFAKDHGEQGLANPASCAKCHGETNTCSSCHHSDPNVPGYTFDQNATWLQQHDDSALKTGPAACFECHQPTFCSHCHVRGFASTPY